jgi:hypothetical protein
LPPFPSRRRDSGLRGQKPFSLLTVAGQFVIFTQFPIIPGITRGPFPLDEEKRKNFVLPGKNSLFSAFSVPVSFHQTKSEKMQL